MRKWVNKLERKLDRFAIPNLMMFIVIGQFTVFAANLLFPAFNIIGKCYFDVSAVMRGEIWRVLTFIFCPPSSSILWIIFSLFFYYMIGSALENEWGTFKFNLYYLIGWLGTIASALITYAFQGYGFMDNAYLNLSLFFAFAVLFPDYQLMVFFIIPVKVKWLAILDAIFFIVQLILGSWMTRAAIIVAILNFLLFFGGDFINHIKEQLSYQKTRRNFRKTMNKYKW